MDIKISDEFFYRIQEKDESLFSKFNTCKENVLRNNIDLPLYKGEVVRIKVNDYFTHIVKPAQTLEIISNKYGIDANKLKTDNSLKENKLFIGQRLKIYINGKQKNP